MIYNYNDLQNHATSCSTKESNLLQQLREETEKKVPGAHMISSPLQGRLLAMVSRILQPKIVLEIGTYTGYSTLCLAEGLVKGSTLYTLERNATSLSIAKKYFNQSPFREQIIPYQGTAQEVLPTLPSQIDLVFIDADKASYPIYYELCLPKLKKGGIIIADNMFMHGKIFSSLPQNSKAVEGIIKFTQLIKSDSRVEKILLPIRDGLYMIRKT